MSIASMKKKLRTIIMQIMADILPRGHIVTILIHPLILAGTLVKTWEKILNEIGTKLLIRMSKIESEFPTDER